MLSVWMGKSSATRIFNLLNPEVEAAPRKFAREIAKEYPNDMCLIVVAGMKYAAYVSAKGYDVIEGAELLAEEQAKKLLKQLEFH